MQKVMVPDFVMGIDLGDKFSRYCVLDAQGDVVEEGRVATTRKGLTDLLDDREPVRIAIEVGTHSPWISRLIAKLGHRVIIANPRQVRLIYQNKKKNDSLDAENLARLARVDPKLLAPVQHRSSEAQASLAILRARDALVRSRTELVNHVRGSVKSFGFRLPGSSTRYFHRKVVDDIPFELRPALDPLLDLLKEITERISAFDQELEALSETKYPETSRLRQIHGVGVLTALAFVLIIEDPRRFARSRTVGAFVGLTPRQSDSGDAQPQLRITKAGDEYLRRLLVGSAQHILGPFGVDCDLRRWGEALAQRGGKNAKKRAIVAVSRKLAVLLHRLWISGEAYEPLRTRGGIRRRA